MEPISKADLVRMLHDKIYANIQASSKTVNYGFVDTLIVDPVDPKLGITEIVALSRIKRLVRGERYSVESDGVTVHIPTTAEEIINQARQRKSGRQFRNKVTIEIAGMEGYDKGLKFKLFTTFRYHIPGLKHPRDMLRVLQHIKEFMDFHKELLGFSILYGEDTFRCMIKRNEAHLGLSRIVLQDFYSFIVNSGKVSDSRISYCPLKGRGLAIYETRLMTAELEKKYMAKGDTYRISTTVHSTGSFSIKGIFKKTQRLEMWELLAQSLAEYIMSDVPDD